MHIFGIDRGYFQTFFRKTLKEFLYTEFRKSRRST